MGQKLDLAGEVPLEGIGDSALAGAVLAVNHDALPLAEVDDQLPWHPAEGVHAELLDAFSHG